MTDDDSNRTPEIIVAPTDFGPASDAAIDHAIERARATGAEVVLVHAIPAAPFPVVPLPPAGAGTIAAHAKANDAAAVAPIEAQLARIRRAGVDASARISPGPPVEAIVEAADELDANEIVMGRRNRWSLLRLLTGGGTVRRTIDAVDCPVTAVRASVS